jgi:outer membrane PBP1 activator LpoA protein
VAHIITKYSFTGCLLVLAFVLAGCSNLGGIPVGLTNHDPLKARAEKLAAKQDYRGAAQVYIKSTTGLTPQKAGNRQLTAITYLMRGKQWSEASSQIKQLNPQTLSPVGQDRLKLARTQLLLVNQKADAALRMLDTVKAPDLLPNAGLGYYQLRAAASELNGDVPESIKQLVWLDGLLTRSGEISANQQSIWSKLSSLPDAELQEMRQLAIKDTLGGWVELAFLVRLNQYSSASIDTTLESWHRDYTGHPARRTIIPGLQTHSLQTREMTGRIAVLLPLSGRTAKQAAAIRDGIILAHSQNSLSSNAVMVYDTDNGPVWQKYQDAVADGADFIIGPLLKQRVSELANAGQLTIPVLALNQTDQEISLSQPLYQFGLNPEDEAGQAAQRAYLDGHQRVIALIPENAWGERLLQAFTKVWHAYGGTLLAVERYPARTVDFTKQITRALNLDKSKQRHQSLVRLLGSKAEFEPRRRQDIDAVFIAAFPREARQIQPQLKFHRAGGLPIYATSHIYTGTPDPERDNDLNAIRFCDIPWVLGDTGDSVILRSKIAELWQNRADHYQRLFALGIDAYRVLPRLNTLGLQSTADFNGMTGNLSLDESRRLHRRLECAIFKRGLPDSLGSMPELAPVSSEPIQQPNAVIEWSTR